MDAKLTATLLKIRKRTYASLTNSAIVSALAAIGWKTEKVLNLRRFKSYAQREPLKHPDSFSNYGDTKEDVERLFSARTMIDSVTVENGIVVPPSGLKLEKGMSYWSDAVHRPSDLDEAQMQHIWVGLNWEADTAIRITAPNGDKLDLFGKATHDFWPWAYEHGLEEAVCALLGMKSPTEEKAEKEEAKRLKYRHENHCGKCPVCGGDYKRTHGNKMVHHGYERPGDGYIHGDCYGVGYLPYEVSDEGCVAYKALLAPMVIECGIRMDALVNGKVISMWVKLVQGEPAVEITPEHKEWTKQLEIATIECKQKLDTLKSEVARMDQWIKDWLPIPLA